ALRPDVSPPEGAQRASRLEAAPRARGRGRSALERLRSIRRRRRLGEPMRESVRAWSESLSERRGHGTEMVVEPSGDAEKQRTSFADGNSDADHHNSVPSRGAEKLTGTFIPFDDEVT